MEFIAWFRAMWDVVGSRPSQPSWPQAHRGGYYHTHIHGKSPLKSWDPLPFFCVLFFPMPWSLYQPTWAWLLQWKRWETNFLAYLSLRTETQVCVPTVNPKSVWTEDLFIRESSFSTRVTSNDNMSAVILFHQTNRQQLKLTLLQLCVLCIVCMFMMRSLFCLYPNLSTSSIKNAEASHKCKAVWAISMHE